MTIKTKLLLGYLVTSLLIVVISAITVYGFTTTQTQYDTILSRNTPVTVALREIQYYFTGQSNDERGFLLTGGGEFKNEITQKSDQIKMRLQLIQGLVTTDKEKQLLQEITNSHEQFTQINYKVISLYNEGKIDEAKSLSFGEGRKIRKELEASFNNFVKINQANSENTEGNLRLLLQQMKGLIIGVSAIAIIFGICIGIFMSIYITKPIKKVTSHIAKGDLNIQENIGTSQDEIGQLVSAFMKMVIDLKKMVLTIKTNAEHISNSSKELSVNADQSAQAANQVAQSIAEVAINAEQQLSVTNATSAVVEQMSASIHQISANANQVATQSTQAANKANEGNKLTEKAVIQMTNIEKAVSTSAQFIGKLGDRSKEIGQIVDIISSIASQTNLLALNAAIEAARAGEQGRGFSVVAEEVRKLAEQSQDAAKQIAILISEIQGDTEKAVLAMNNGTSEVKLGANIVNASGQAFQEITTMVSLGSEQMIQISVAVEQMAIGSQKIVSSVKQIEELSKKSSGEAQTVSAATEQQSASTEEIASSSQTLAHLVTDLNAAVSKFQV
ncbi:MAG: methyl-accepting chemotaxis protein [Sporomusaceae bacterium]|nr:methyl-accepting chemotaxis protein [Sporomusaceae bacterium]